MKSAVVDVSASPFALLTSDRPVEIARLKEPQGVVSIPISPTKLFVAVNDPRTLDHLRATSPRKLVRTINEFVVGRARRFVWASDEFQTRFIENRMSKKVESTPLFPGIGQYPGAA